MTVDFEEWLKRNIPGVYDVYVKDPNQILTLNIEDFFNALEKAFNHFQSTK